MGGFPKIRGTSIGILGLCRDYAERLYRDI